MISVPIRGLASEPYDNSFWTVSGRPDQPSKVKTCNLSRNENW